MLLIDCNSYEYRGFANALESKIPGIKWDHLIFNAREALRAAQKAP